MQVRRERVKCRRTYCWHNDTRFNYERTKRVAGWHGKHQPKDKVDHLAEVVDEPQDIFFRRTKLDKAEKKHKNITMADAALRAQAAARNNAGEQGSSSER